MMGRGKEPLLCRFYTISLAGTTQSAKRVSAHLHLHNTRLKASIYTDRPQLEGAVRMAFMHQRAPSMHTGCACKFSS